MNVASPAQLPVVQPLEARVTLAPDAAGNARFVDLVQVDPRDSFGRKDSFASLEDAMRAARHLSATKDTPVAVVSGLLDLHFGSGDEKPSWFVSQLRAERTGVVGGAWEQAAPGTRLGAAARVTGVETRDLSEIRYVMWNEAIQAVVDGAVELRRGDSWTVLPTMVGH